MDIILHYCDEYALDAVYSSVLPFPIARENIYRQFASLYSICAIFGASLYFFYCSVSYYFVFDHRTLKHPKFLKNQVRQEIACALEAIPFLSLYTTPWFLIEVRGYSKLYGDIHDHGLIYLLLQFPLFFLFTDSLIYFIHRGLHHPLLYKRLHKSHHKWIMPTPFASFAFHPLDGYLQSLPYHIFPFIFPLHKLAYISLFAIVNLWTMLIHDGEYFASNPIINGTGCHTLHHLYFNYNYGQFTTLWDRLCGSYRQPSVEQYDKETKMTPEMWKKQISELEGVVLQVEGSDDREYSGWKQE